MTLAEKLRELRMKKRKSLQEVANEVGSSKAHIWDLETSRAKNPSLELVVKLAKCFDVSVSELVGENPSGENESPQLVAMYRELKELSEGDRKAIQSMMDHFKKREG